MQPFLKKRYKVTIDNYFSSTNLADKLKVKKLLFLEQEESKEKRYQKLRK